MSRMRLLSQPIESRSIDATGSLERATPKQGFSPSAKMTVDYLMAPDRMAIGRS